MIALFTNLAALERGFTLSAIVGALLLGIRLLLLFFGGDADDADGFSADSDADFRVISLQGLMAFLLIFGLTGRALLLETEMSQAGSFAIALLAGLAAMWAMAWMFMLMRRLQDSGTMDIQKAVGQKGEVYLTLPAGGSGEVQVIFSGKMQIHDAISEDGQAIETGARIDVVGVTGSNTLVVKRDAGSTP